MKLKSIYFLVFIFLSCASIAQTSKSDSNTYVKKIEMRNGKQTEVFLMETATKYFEIAKQGNVIIEFKIDGIAIPKNEIRNNLPLIKSLLQQYYDYAKKNNLKATSEKLNDQEGVKVNLGKNLDLNLYDEDIADMYEKSKNAGQKVWNKIKGIFE